VVVPLHPRAGWRRHREAQDEKHALEAKVERLQAGAMEKTAALVESLRPKAAVLDADVMALQARLEALHGARLLTDEQLFGLEDVIGDFVELSVSMVAVTVTADMAGVIVEATKVRKIVGMSKVIASDAAFARQLVRKFV
jgi:hypothetical protein